MRKLTRLAPLLVMGWPLSARALTHVETPPDSFADDASIAELLSGMDLSTDLERETELDAQWALGSILRSGFARTTTTAHQVNRALAPPGRKRRSVDWLDQYRRRQVESLLRLDVEHESALATRAEFDIPLADNPMVDLYIKYFTGRGRWYFAKWLARADRYIPLMTPILEAHGLPRDLVYVAMVESGFSARAVSSAAACGFWQFIRSTGRLYGMEMTFWVDERRDFVRATQAATAYLTDLYREFGDWHLAWAGYNAGGGRVRRALAKYQTRDYWHLVDEKRGLAKETLNYVPKIVAAAIISKNRKRYGFDHVAPLPPLKFDTVPVKDAIDLHVVARELRVSMDALRELNPALLHDVTPPNRPFTLRVPEGLGPQTTAWLESLPADQRLTYRHHKIHKGDTLHHIASRFGTTIEAIRDFNRIRNPRALRVGRDLIIPTIRGRKTMASKHRVARAAKPRKAPLSARATTTKNSSANSGRHHIVAAGETLWSISQKYGLTVQELKSRNGLRNNRILAGARLRVF